MSVETAYAISRLGVNPDEAYLLNKLTPEQRQDYLGKELERYVNHTLEDLAVSLPYYYTLGKTGEIETYPSKIPLAIDIEERDGLYNLGVTNAAKSAVDDPHKLVFLYSPPGPIVFDNNPNNKYREVKPYDRGQLNIMFFDGQKINNVSVLISTPQGKEWLVEILEDVYSNAYQQADEISRISYFITHPKVTNYDIHEFLNLPWTHQERIIFRNRSGHDFTLAETLKLISESFAGKLKPAINTFDKTLQELERYQITRDFVFNLYQQTVYDFMEKRGLTELTLGGGCGGSTIKRSSFEFSVFELINNLSSPAHLLTQSGLDFLQNDYYPDYECPNPKCKEVLKGEKKNDPASWKTHCPKCGTELNCKQK